MHQTKKEIARLTKLLAEVAKQHEEALNAGLAPNLKLAKQRKG
jgi:hypothetical protein